MSRIAKRYLGFIPVPALLFIVALLHFIVKPSLFYEPTWLLPVTNTLFVTVVCFIIAYIAIRNYRMSGKVQVLLLGCGVFAFGIAAVIAAFLRDVPQTGANLNVTVYNTGALVAALFHFVAALILLSGISMEAASKRKGLWAAGSYIALAAFMGLLTMASLRGITPPFFVQGVGATPLRQEVLGTADILFAFSFLIFMGAYLKNREIFLYWYASALALTSISLTGFYIQSAVGSPIGWASRFAQYLGGIYFLIAVLAAVRGSQARHISFDRVLTVALSPAEERFRALSENSPDSISRFDRGMRHIYINQAAIKLYGKPPVSLVGKTITESGLPEEYCSALKERIARVFETGRPTQMEDYVPSGESVLFCQSRCVPEYGPDGTVANVLVVSRDLTDRKRAEDALSESMARLDLALQSAEMGAWHWNIQEDKRYFDDQVCRLLGIEPATFSGSAEEFFDAVHPDDRERLHEALSRTVEQDLPYEPEYRTVWPDGTIHHIAARGRLFRDDAGRPLRINGIIWDITDRKQMEDALRRSEARYRNLFENMTEEVHLWNVIRDGDGRINTWRLVDANPPTLKTWGKTLEEIQHRTTDEIFGLGATEHYMPIVQKIISTGIPHSYEDYFPNLDKHFRFTSVPFGDYFITTGADITGIRKAQLMVEQQNAELEKRVAERTADVEKERRRLYDVLETLPAMVCLLTSDYHVPFANKAFRAQFGEASGRKCFEYCFGRKEPCEFCESFKVLKSGEPHHWEVNTPDGHVIDAHDFPFTDVDGSPLVLEMDMDITEQRRVEKALQSAYSYNRSLIEAALDPLVTIDPRGRITDVNAATERATGRSRNELIGTDFSDYFTDPAKARSGYRKVFNEGAVHDYPLELRHRDGRVTPVLYNASVYRNEAGEVIGIFAAARDISEQQRLEAQLRQSQKMEALGTLTGGIAHDFNNILAAVIGFAEIGEDKVAGNPDATRAVKRIFEAGIRGRELVKQMLTFSRKTEQEKKPLLLSSIVKETAKLLRASTPTTISIKVDVKNESGLVLADPVQIQQVLMNLCTNAAYAMREKGGVLEVELRDFSRRGGNGILDEIPPGLYMRLTVRDTGVGIPVEIRDKIFDPFFTTKKLGEGTGLGLSVVHGIVKQHDGHITVESELGKGSTFTVYLPKFEEMRPADEALDETIPTGNERVLFVDDEEPLAEMGEELLSKLGYRVTIKTSSTEALALLKADPTQFDVLITDQTMPDMTGVQLAREVLALCPDMPIIMCTGFSHLVDAETAKEAGIKAFTLKPVTKKEIARTVRKVLDE